jgi:hypothetical protein
MSDHTIYIGHAAALGAAAAAFNTLRKRANYRNNSWIGAPTRSATRQGVPGALSALASKNPRQP